MERLTYRDKAGNVMMAFEHEEKYTTREWIDLLENRLAEYEDTGLEPEQIFGLQTHPDHAYADYVKSLFPGMDRMEELAQADREGRLIVVPCKVGTSCFAIERDSGFNSKEALIRAGGKLVCRHTLRLHDMYKLGKTVFLTRAEAEAALEGGANNG